MICRIFVACLVLSLFLLLSGFDVPIGHEKSPPETTKTLEEQTGQGGAQEAPSDGGIRQTTVEPPKDPCLPEGCKEWGEIPCGRSADPAGQGFVGARIIVDRTNYHLYLEGIRSDGAVEEVYDTPVGIGDEDTPTPEGHFLINHVYPYPDVLFYGENKKKIPGLYAGFFAPVLACDESGKCVRYRELGIHGFDPASYPHPETIKTDPFGPSSAGCIRVPDPCVFKKKLIGLVGVGPVRRNERGTYHWLKKPVEVWVLDDDGIVLSVLKYGFNAAGEGLGAVLSVFGF